MPTVAYRVTRSRQKFMFAPKIKQYLANVLDTEVKPHFIKRFDLVVMNWKHRVTFKARKFIRVDRMWVNVFPDKHKDIWEYVTKGTRPHAIRPKKAKVLAFPWGGPGSYRPKTSPPAKFGGPGVVVGATMRFLRGIWHPGTKGRPFPAEIAKDEKAWFSRTMENAWRRAIRRL